MLQIVLFCEAWMDKQEIIDGINALKTRLLSEVKSAYKSRGFEYGGERFRAWEHTSKKFLQQYLPAETERQDKIITYGFIDKKGMGSRDSLFMNGFGKKIVAHLDSLTLDIKNDEYDFTPRHKDVPKVTTQSTPKAKSNKVFIVHGHDEAVKERTARFLDKIGYEAMILHELPSMGKTIIEKIEHYAQDTNFAIVLYTPDDKGETADTVDSGDSQFRARQNVIFEHGYLIGLLSRENVTAINIGAMELPSDINGMVYIGNDWKIKVAHEMKHAGYNIDMNKLY
jgi:predicted nucleotide-binding protein